MSEKDYNRLIQAIHETNKENELRSFDRRHTLEQGTKTQENVREVIYELSSNLDE